MAYDPDIEQFFQKLKSAKSASDKSEPTATPQRVVILPEMDGDIVARHDALGEDFGTYRQAQSGEIFFYYRYDESHRWYVNKSMNAFRVTAAAFNRCCEFLCTKDENDETACAGAVAQLRAELETVEPLGDSETSLWSATIHNTEGGLLTLY